MDQVQSYIVLSSKYHIENCIPTSIHLSRLVKRNIGNRVFYHMNDEVGRHGFDHLDLLVRISEFNSTEIP